MFTTVNLIGLLVDLIIGGLIVYACYLFLGMLNLPTQIRSLVLLVIAVIALIFLAQIFGVRA